MIAKIVFVSLLIQLPYAHE